jgi:hypothetical protein
LHIRSLPAITWDALLQDWADWTKPSSGEGKKRIAALIAELTSSGAICPRRLLDPIFDHFWSAHVGHTALLAFRKENVLKAIKRLSLVRLPKPYIANECLLALQYFTILIWRFR